MIVFLFQIQIVSNKLPLFFLIEEIKVKSFKTRFSIDQFFEKPVFLSTVLSVIQKLTIT